MMEGKQSKMDVATDNAVTTQGPDTDDRWCRTRVA